MKEIVLKAGIDDSLKWEEALAEASEAKGKEICWVFDLGLNLLKFPFEDPMQFEAFSLALGRFSEEIFPEFEQETKKIVLYRGSSNFSSHFIWSETQEKNWELWQKEQPERNLDLNKRLFCSDTYAYYFQMLSHKLPDLIPISLQFLDEKEGSLAERETLLSKERFEHFDIERLDEEKGAPVAVLFPELSFCSQKVLSEMDALFQKISTSFRVIHEPFLIEEWEGVDDLIVNRRATSSGCIRKLKGLNAAGGRVVTLGDLFDLELEISFEDFLKEIRGRGI